MKLLLLTTLLVCLTVAVSAGVHENCKIPVNVTMRDGINLYTCFDFPEGGEKRTNLTAILDRSPYGSDATELLADLALLLKDMVGVRQDMRGTFDSGGQFTLWANAANDTYDTLQYVSKQTWSAQGRTLSVGASADGLSLFAAPKARPYPWLQAAFIIWSSDDGYSIFYPGGAYRQSLIESWLHFTLPGQATGLLAEVQANEAPSSWWDRLNATTAYENVQYPTVMWGGWYDIFLIGQLQGYYNYQHRSPSAGQHYIVIDPLGHCFSGGKYFPENSNKGRASLPLLLALEMFQPTGKVPENVKQVTFYVMGAHDEAKAAGNYWTSLDDFPDFTPTNYFFNADHSLTTSPPTASNSSLSFVFDPTNPVPSLGGNNLFVPCGPLDQQQIEKERDDILLFTSDVLKQPLAITGPLTVTLYVSSDAVDTDFTAKLTDVYPSGESALIQDGIIRMRWRDLVNGANTPSLLTPGQMYGPISITLWNTSFIFNEGHRMRVAISSSNYPRFGVNPNNGLPLTKASDGPNITATNTLYMSSMFPSYITLPIIPDYEKALPFVFVDATEPVAEYLNSRADARGDDDSNVFWKAAKDIEMQMAQLASLSSSSSSTMMMSQKEKEQAKAAALELANPFIVTA